MSDFLRIATMAAGLLAAIASSSAAQENPHDSFGEADGRRLIDRLADAESALAGVDEAAGHFAPLATLVAREPYAQLAGTVPGLLGIALLRSEAGPAETEATLTFADEDEANALRALVDEKFGPSDPACSNATVAHWLPEPDLSLRWRMTVYDSAQVQLTLIAADPPDGNCARTSAPEGAVIDVDEMAAFFQRLRDEPPPFADAPDMAAWLAPYGEMEITREEECSAAVETHSPDGPSGIASLHAGLEFCSFLPTDRPSILTLLSAPYADMFARVRMAEAATAVFGPKDEGCSAEDREVWAADDDLTLSLVDLFSSFGLLVIDGPKTLMDDCGP